MKLRIAKYNKERDEFVLDNTETPAQQFIQHLPINTDGSLDLAKCIEKDLLTPDELAEIEWNRDYDRFATEHAENENYDDVSDNLKP